MSLEEKTQTKKSNFIPKIKEITSLPTNLACNRLKKLGLQVNHNYKEI